MCWIAPGTQRRRSWLGSLETGTAFDRGAGRLTGVGRRDRSTGLRTALEGACAEWVELSRAETVENHGFLKKSRSWRRMPEAPYVGAGEAGIPGVLAGRDKGSAYAPKRGQGSRMLIELHAAYRSG